MTGTEDQSPLETQTANKPVVEILDNKSNQFEPGLVDQGFDFSIPEKYTQINDLATSEKPLIIDELTGVVVEDDKVRTHVAQKLSECIQNGKEWACLYSDTDNLKAANEIHRKLGDMAIRYGASSLINAVDSAGLNQEAEIIVTRQTGAADETLIWIFGIDQDVKQKLADSVNESAKPKRSKNPDYQFSSTTSIVFSEDERIAEVSEATKKWLAENPSGAAHDLLEKAREIGDTEAKIGKIAKDIARLPADQLLSADGIDQTIDILRENLGNSRISKPLLEAVLRFTAIKAVLSVNVSPEVRSTVISELGVSETDFKKTQSEEDRIELYKRMFNKQ